MEKLYAIKDCGYYFILIINGFRQNIKSISINYKISEEIVWDKLEEYNGYVCKKFFSICFYSRNDTLNFIEFLQTLEVVNQLSNNI